ncbi:uncharacterized protein EDB93DRAFT_1106635 [Suillus bovinus]|uniref:uncharacterized protein n=1 Tax=Suillus bovinus TaxID=48563 RepID=UPI001B8709BC|nr:uncharacterized protein EDB93DRAFT_1106635 [Suillus bovinus]KAG2137443.1 hypothetical protein EDB93DRAFT_1106635 [Suillus bovinus]
MPPRQKNTSWVAPKAAPAPITATPLTATPAVAPIAAAANVSVLQNPPRRHQLPVRFRDNGSSSTADKGESFHLENISDDEEDKAANPPALTVTPVVCPSPLQTAMNTARTDPLATGGRAKPPKSSADIHFFYRQDPVTQSRICKACKEIHTRDNTHAVVSYLATTGTTGRQTHTFNEHTIIYLEEAECNHWHIHASSHLKTFLDDGWMIATLHQQLKDPAYTLDSLGTPPSPSSLTSTILLAPDDVLPNFTLDKMHKQIVRFIIANDQSVIAFRQSVLLNAQNFAA